MLKKALILFLFVNALFSLDELPGWPIATVRPTRPFFGTPILEDIGCIGTSAVILAGPDNLLRVIQPNGTYLPGYPITLPGIVRTNVAVGKITDSWLQMALVTDDGLLCAFNANGSAIPGFPVDLGASPGPAGPVIWDLDGDGYGEIIVHAGNVINVVDHSGINIAGFPVFAESEYGPAGSPAVGDIDRDGIYEIVAIGYRKIFVFSATGEVFPGFPVILPDSQAFSYSSPVLADLDRNGTLEICCGYHSLSSINRGYFGVWNSNGSMRSGWPIAVGGYGSWIYSSPAIGDVDGDGLPEISFASRAGRVYLANHDATSPSPWSIALSIGNLESSPAILDFNGDGGPDILFLGNDARGTITCLNAIGNAISSFPFIADTAWGLSAPAVKDIDGDGYLEICAVDLKGKIHLFRYPGDGRRYMRPWAMSRHDPLRSGFFHPEPPETLIVHKTGDSLRLHWARSEQWDFKQYNIYRTMDARDSSGGFLLVSTTDTFAVLPDDPIFKYYFVTSSTFQLEGTRSHVARIDSATNISEIHFPISQELVVFPNPFNSSVRIRMQNTEFRIQNVEVYDITGREVFSVSDAVFKQSRNSFEFIWAPEPFIPSGVYLVRARFDGLSNQCEGKIAEKKIVYLR